MVRRLPARPENASAVHAAAVGHAGGGQGRDRRDCLAGAARPVPRHRERCRDWSSSGDRSRSAVRSSTAGGLVFTAGTLEAAIYAFDVQTGEQLWKGTLPTSARSTPMTYLGPDGRQVRRHLRRRPRHADRPAARRLPRGVCVAEVERARDERPDWWHARPEGRAYEMQMNAGHAMQTERRRLRMQTEGRAYEMKDVGWLVGPTFRSGASDVPGRPDLQVGR